MPLSKLESLPDEILFELIEKYINGVDLICTFYRQLNQRFDRLISRCQRISFDFRRCQKTEFWRCLDIFPSYVDKIERLILSDENAPGQVQLFFSHFQALTLFVRLRSLSLFIHDDAFDRIDLIPIVRSIKSTQIETIALGFHEDCGPPDLTSIVLHVLSFQSIKRLHLYSASSYELSLLRLDQSCPLKLLNLSKILISCQSLQKLSRCFPNLRYLSVGLSNATSAVPLLTMAPMNHLHILDLSLRFATDWNFETLRSLLEAMPALKHLTVELCQSLTNAFRWQQLIETASPDLVDLTLWINRSSLVDVDPSDLLRSFQNPFWIKQQNFHFIIVTRNCSWCGVLCAHSFARRLDHDGRAISHILIAPKRSEQSPPSIIRGIHFINLEFLKTAEISEYRFVDVDSLLVCTPVPKGNGNLLALVDCSRITSLIILRIAITSVDLNLLFQRLIYLRLLRIHHLLLQQIKKSVPSLISLDLYEVQHEFDHTFRSKIARLFPALECLKIRSEQLELIPSICTVLPRLRYLEFYDILNGKQLLLADMMLRLPRRIPIGTAIPTASIPKSISIWIDDNILQDPFWKSYPCKIPANRRSSNRRSTKSVMLSCFPCSK